MTIDKFNSMSVDELWSLHEQIRAVLSSKMSEEKRRLERKLSRLRAEAPSI
jgi:DNA-binding protein H-NS